MKKYLTTFLDSNSYSGGSKARQDTSDFLRTVGWEEIKIGSFHKNNCIKYSEYIWGVLSILWKVKTDDILFVQYPITTKFQSLIYFIVHLKKINLLYFVHDLDSLRENYITISKEINRLNHAKFIITNTKKIEERLYENGLNKDIKIRNIPIWFYKTRDNQVEPQLSMTICFAGSLKKAQFVKDLHRIKELEFFVYGGYGINKSNVKYLGVFNSDDVPLLLGDWGLVWDGNSIENCSGSYGDYLLINSSHKAGLYISQNKPLIVWRKSAIANIVEKEHLGILVDSLFEISYRIRSLSIEEKDMIIKSVTSYSILVRNGTMLYDALEVIN